jgi:CDP-glycerol glycerophosphotransferase (TagB/SpsB family)
VRRLAILAWISIVRVAFAGASLLPIRRRVVLATAHIPYLAGNLAAIRAELARRQPPIPMVTLVHTRRSGVSGRVRATAQALVAGYHMATARVFIVDSYFLPLYVIRPRPGTTVVQTWHACGAIKKIGYSVMDKTFGADETLISLVRLHSNYDVCLAASHAAALQFVEAFRQPLDLFVTDLGIPSTDVLCGEDRTTSTSEAIRRRYAIPTGRRTVLYAPTFRGDSLTTARHPDGLDLHLLARTLGDDHVLLLRAHPAVRSGLRIDPPLDDFVIDVSDYPEVNELMLVSDVLVTDYSSVIFEYALLGRPIALFAPDTDAYERERGFYFDYRLEVPGPVFETTVALATYLRAGEFDLEPVKRFATKWFEIADGHASERLVDQIVLPALKGSSRQR